MRPLLLLVMATAVFAGPADARKSGQDAPPPDCALEAQRAVAHRHGLHETVPDALSLKIYADPKLAQEADDAFDACVRRQLLAPPQR